MLDPRYYAVIGRRSPNGVIMRTALYRNKQQKTLVSLSCHICWFCTACCKCYQLGYQISAAAPYTAMNRGPIQCNVEAVCVYNVHVPAYLPLSTVSFASSWAATYLLCSHYCWSECTSAESTNLFSVPCYCIHVNVHPVYTHTALVSRCEKSESMTLTVL